MLCHKPLYNGSACKAIYSKIGLKVGLWNLMKYVSVHGEVALEIVKGKIFIVQMKKAGARQNNYKIYLFCWDMLENGYLLVVD